MLLHSEPKVKCFKGLSEAGLVKICQKLVIVNLQKMKATSHHFFQPSLSPNHPEMMLLNVRINRMFPKSKLWAREMNR